MKELGVINVTGPYHSIPRRFPVKIIDFCHAINVINIHYNIFKIHKDHPINFAFMIGYGPIVCYLHIIFKIWWLTNYYFT